MSGELTVHTGTAGDVTTIYVDWHDENNAHHEGRVEIVVEPADKPRKVHVRVEGLPVEGQLEDQMLFRVAKVVDRNLALDEQITRCQEANTALVLENRTLKAAVDEAARLREALLAAEADYKQAGDERDAVRGQLKAALLGNKKREETIQHLQAEVKQLKDWRADVTVALRRPGGVAFVDVPRLVTEAVASAEQVRDLLRLHKDHSLPLHLAGQRKWSAATFGPGPRTGMVLDHMVKEIAEVRRNPYDLEEWIDLLTLALDGYWRHGGRSLEVVTRLREKLAKNQARQWPDWRTHDPQKAIEHVRPPDGALPWCKACQSYHHPANPTCRQLAPGVELRTLRCSAGCDRDFGHTGPCDDVVEPVARRRHGGQAASPEGLYGLLRQRAQWYRDGCPFLEEATDEYKLGHLAADAGDDLDDALNLLTQAKDLLQLVFNRGTIECLAPGMPKPEGHLRWGCCVACQVRALLTPGWWVRPEAAKRPAVLPEACEVCLKGKKPGDHPACKTCKACAPPVDSGVDSSGGQ